MRCLECYETDWAYHPKGSLGNEMINDMFQKKVSTILFQSPLRSKLFLAVNCVWSANYLDVLYTILL